MHVVMVDVIVMLILSDIVFNYLAMLFLFNHFMDFFVIHMVIVVIYVIGHHPLNGSQKQNSQQNQKKLFHEYFLSNLRESLLSL